MKKVRTLELVWYVKDVIFNSMNFTVRLLDEINKLALKYEVSLSEHRSEGDFSIKVIITWEFIVYTKGLMRIL